MVLRELNQNTVYTKQTDLFAYNYRTKATDLFHSYLDNVRFTKYGSYFDSFYGNGFVLNNVK